MIVCIDLKGRDILDQNGKGSRKIQRLLLESIGDNIVEAENNDLLHLP